MRHLQFGIPFAGLLLGIVGLTGCSDENPWGQQSQEKGSISVTLQTFTDITTAKPMFRSDENGDAADPNNLSTYITIPDSKDFHIRLEKADGTYCCTWNSLSDFLDDNTDTLYDTGSYTMTAYSGEKGKQDFESPYFEASSTFNVLSDQVQNVELVAELKNSMVKVNYTDAFRDYMKDFHTSIRTEGLTDEIVCNRNETRPVFIEPNNANLTVHFTTKDRNFTGAVSLGQFPPMAKTLHNITLDIAENINGDAQLQVLFDSTLEEEPVSVDLTDELYTTPAPVITCEGFTNGETLDMLASTASETPIKMNVKAKGKIQSAILTIASVYFTPVWGSTIDLCQASPEEQQQLRDAGIEAIGFGFDRPADEEAVLDLKEYSKSLPKGEHTISLVVTDRNEAVSQPAKVTLNSQDIELEVIDAPALAYGATRARVTLDYNGANPTTEVTFNTIDNNGNWVDARVINCEEETATRAFDKKRYVYTIEISPATQADVDIEIFHQGTKSFGTYQIPVIIPQYQISAYDAFSHYAYVKIEADASVLEAVTDNIVLQGNDEDLVIGERDAAAGIIMVQGLESGKEYSVKSSIDQKSTWNSGGTFTTESALAIPNGDFSQHGAELKNEKDLKDLKVGGEFRATFPPNYQYHSSFSWTLPAGWSTINDLTAWSGASNYNTWYVVPSSWLDTSEQKGFMRNVGYNHNGPDIPLSNWAAATYSKEAPADTDLEKAAGELFLGTYSFNGTAQRTDGIDFASRPTAISFDYEYTLKKDKADNGYAKIEIIATDGTSLGEQTFTLAPGKGTKKITFSQYGRFGAKAAKLIISFKSSNQTTPPIYIPSGTELKEDGKNGTNSKDAIEPNKYHALATGSELKIDNVTATYAESPSAVAKTAKRNLKPKR